ncbi:hypothetical protein GOBAR_AA17169 [Gossypium barbadense]|uniref:Uncharacterized protein n=1 Tax=Gossypium barbadense TaxID=3634 RepID=A0A2P5XJI5_GOSBA|nr:hypothetical protein GOBAR_AA17169 [Gossypium barbadense]
MEVTVAGKPDNSNNSVGRETKKVCRRSKVSMEPDDPMVDENGQQIPDLSLAKASDKAKLLGMAQNLDQIDRMKRRAWVAYGQYLTVHPWLPDFFTTDIGIDVQVAWIRLPGLLKGYYSDFLLCAIRQAISLIIKLDTFTDFAKRGKFERLVVYVDLKKSLDPKVKTNGRTMCGI